MINPFRFLIYAMRYGRDVSFCQRLRRMIAVEWILPYAQPAKRILEVGGGDGHIICFLAKRFPDKEFVVCEKDRKQLERMAQRIENAALRNVTIVDSDLSEIKESGSFDLIFAVDVLEHIRDDRAALLQMKERLAPRGHLFLHVPARGVDVFDDPGHVRPGYSQADLRALLEKAGFRIQRMDYTFGRRGLRYHHGRIILSRPWRALIHLLDLADSRKVKSSIGVLAAKV